MSKKSKKERKAEREAARAAARKAERQRNIFTVIVLGIVVLLGGVLIWVSLDDEPQADELADLLEELELEDEDGPDEAPEAIEDDRPIACGGDLPPRAGEERGTFDEPEQVIDDGVDYEAVIETSCGTITIDLDAERAPEGVNAFVFLATQGFYDGLEIFRHALGLEVFQTGSGTDSADFQIGYTLPDELDAVEDDGYPPGTVAYANAGPGTSGSQFFFVYGDAFQQTVDDGGLQPIYTRFGLVTDGLDVLEEMAEIPVDGEEPAERIYMESVTILADGEPLPVAETAPADDPTPAPDPDDDDTEE